MSSTTRRSGTRLPVFSPPGDRRDPSSGGAARVAAAGQRLCLGGATLGVVGLVGWIAGVPWLTMIVPGQPGMMPNTALALLLIGAAGALRRRRLTGVRRALSLAAAGVALGIGIGSLAEYVFAVDLQIDQILRLGGTGPYPGRPSPPTALALALLGAAIFLLDSRPSSRIRPSEWLALSAGLIAFTAVLGQFFGAGPLYRLEYASVIGVAVPTAISLLLTSLGLLLERPNSGVMRMVTSPGPGGILFRRLTVAAALGPVLLGLILTRFLAVLGVEEFALVYASLTVASTVVALVLLGVTAVPLNRTYAALARAQAIAHLGSWRLDVASNERHWSDETYRIFGIAKGTPLTYEGVLARVHPDDRAYVARISKASIHGEPFDAQYRIIVGAETRWVRARSESHVATQRDRVGTVQDITDLKCVEEKLGLSEQRARALFESAPVGIFIADLDGWYTDVNVAACRILGYSREELVGQTVGYLLPPEDAPRLAAAKQHQLEGGVELGEWRLRRKDGTYMPVDLSANILPDGRWLAFWRDITERREAEVRLSLSEAKFSGIASISADAIISIDEEQRITFFNDGAERIFGYPRAEVLGAPLDVFLPENRRGVHRALVDGFAAGHATARRMGERGRSIVGRRKNGEEFPADAAISKLDLGGRRLLTVALHDITEQKRVELEERFLSEVGRVLATTLDFDETVASVTRLALELADWCAILTVQEDGSVRCLAVLSADPAKQPLAEALRSLDRAPQDLVREVMASRTPGIVASINPEALQAMDDEHRRLVEALGVASLMAIPLVAHGRVLGALIAVSATPRRRFGPSDLRLLEGLGQRAALALENAQLYRTRQQAIEARDGVLAIVAHDLRNPLNTILLQAKVLQMYGQELTAPRRERFAEVVIHAAKQMDRLIKDLLDVTRMEAGGLPIACRAVTPGELLSAAVEEQKILATEAGLDLRVDAADDLPAVWADRERLLQVFGNLVGNALKFTPRGGCVTVGASGQGGNVLFRVEDTGCGIPEDLLPHVFNRFWQAKRVDRRGAGLGLAIARGIVEAHGGLISVESTPGHGTTFSFTVPVVAPSASTP